MAEGKAYYKDYDVEIPETLSAYGYGDSPLTFVSLSDYNGMRKLQGMDSVDLLENNYRILYNKEKCYEDYWGKSTKSSHKCIEGDYVIHSKNLVLKDDITYLLIWDVLFVVVQKRRGKCPTLNVFTTE